MPAPRTAAAINTALLDAVTRSQTLLTSVLDHVGWCDALPPWPRTILTAPADIYLPQAHALAVHYQILTAACPCHRGRRGEITTEAILRWRMVVDHAISFAVLCPSGRTEDLRVYRDRYRAVEATFRHWVGVVVGG
ncbi:hypothetical protein E0F15_11110 [Frankia sp. B2]|uniref:hypothetical protein n=1 Tax=Frankia sp. B2 TaxID=2541730 RepID=UPI0010694ED6|nr:hypothetical protein [Frankia sp. B2]TFE31024.1 hypothetical protein E0F15_11110 [Frankia sp. B2]